MSSLTPDRTRRELHDRVLSYVTRRVRNREDAEDIAQEVKARVQRGRRQLRELVLECCHVELDRRRRVTDVRSRGAGCGTCAQP